MDKSAIEIIRDTMKLDNDGNLEFKIDSGRGRGRPIKIPVADVNSFVDLIKEKTNNQQ